MVVLLIKVVALMISVVTVITEVRLEFEFDVRLNSKLIPDLLSLKMRPSGSSVVNRRVTLGTDGEFTNSTLHCNRGMEPCAANGILHVNSFGCR